MQKVLTAAQMREVDRLTTERYGIPSIILMENAAHAVARVITEKLGGSVKGKSILILCGKGNNGGDGAALARLLHEAGATLQVYLFGKVAETKGDARQNFEKLLAIASTNSQKKGTLCFEEVPTIDYWVHAVGLSGDDFDVLVDALFGTGLKGPLGLTFRYVPLVFRQRREVNGTLNDTGIVISVDVPSGLDSDVANDSDIHVNADATVTFTAAKPANVLPPASRFNGELIVADIGSPPDLIDEQPSQSYVAEKNDAAKWLKQTEFSSDSYKNKRGHVLMIAGSENYSGAAVLTGNAAMRSGVGLVTIGVPKSSKDAIASRVVPEVMVRPLPETDSGAVSENAIEEVEEFSKNVDAIAIGSGLSANDESTERFVRHFVEHRRMPTILDADALTMLSPFKATAASSGDPPLILTPHEGEFLKMLGTEDKDEIKDRVAAVREFSQKHKVILVLKGERSLIGEPGGNVVVNPTGNSGLGKAGNGDTLTGIITGFIAQAAKMKIDIFETVVAAVYIAGMAGDIAEKKFGKRVMTASDVRECLTEAFDQLVG